MSISTLLGYLEEHKNSFAQKSDEWLKDKRFGGSEIAALMGVSPFSKQKDVLARKLGLCPFTGNQYTFWGNMFEEVTKKFSEDVLCIKIFEAGSLPGIMDCQRYSPDGLSVVNLCDVNGELHEYIVLFEFKAPFGSFPPGRIPPHYMPQVQTGLASIPVAECAIFVNNLYRKCEWKDFASKNADYDCEFHAADFRKRMKGARGMPIAGGVLLFHRTRSGEVFANSSPEEDEIYWLNEERKLLRQIGDDPIDFGEPGCAFRSLLGLVDKGHVRVEYLDVGYDMEELSRLPVFGDNPHFLEKKQATIEEVKARAETRIEEGGFFGFLPWKLMISDVLVIDKKKNWKKQLRKTLVEASELLDKFLATKDPVREYLDFFREDDDDECFGDPSQSERSGSAKKRSAQLEDLF
jgi:hypothetical protein